MGINNIIVITPYKQQERMLQLYLQKGLRIGTVDKFQGQEDEVTIISMVRSNNRKDYREALGFVNIPRSCVAFSRSKRKTIIVGDRDTLIKSKFLSKSIDTITRKDGFSIGEILTPIPGSRNYSFIIIILYLYSLIDLSI